MWSKIRARDEAALAEMRARPRHPAQCDHVWVCRVGDILGEGCVRCGAVCERDSRGKIVKYFSLAGVSDA